ncbi:MAG: ABC transporter permease [Acidimicrobiales bacterium]
MTELLEYAVRGIPTGCVFALLAVGLVLTYKTSGVFNLAFAAQAYASAAVFYTVRKDHEWPLVWAFLLAVVIVGPAIGLLLERLLFRYLRGAGSMAKLVTSLGLLIAIPEIVKLFFGSDSKKNPPPLWYVTRTDEWLWPQGSRFVLDAGQVVTILSTVIVVIGLFLLFRFTQLGLRMRAVVESSRMAELNGVDSNRVSMVSWVLSSLLAGLAGVLLAPLFASLNPIDLFTLLVAALAATVFGGLTSIPLTFAGGILLGVLQAVLAGKLPTDSVLSTGLRPALPFVVLFGLLLLRPGLRTTKELTDPLATVDPPPPAPISLSRPRWMAMSTRVFAGFCLLIAFWLCWFVLDGYWLGLVVGGVILGIIMLSLTVVFGIGGMLSLCQAALAAIGAFTTAQMVNNFNMSVLVAVFIGAAVAAAVGVFLALPVVRLDGVYLALATLAFALMFESVLVPLGWVSGGAIPLRVPRPVIGPWDLADDRYFLLFAVICLTIVSIGVIRLRQGTTGRFLGAIRSSDVAAASIGISSTRSRIVAFTVAAAIAGFGGGLVATFTGQANYNASFPYLIGLVWVALLISAGARNIQAAVMSGLFFFLAPALLTKLFTWPDNWLVSNPDAPSWLRSILEPISPTWANSVAFILFGIGAITYAKHPEGSIEAQTNASTNAVIRRVERRKANQPPNHPSDQERSADGSTPNTLTGTSGVVSVGAKAEEDEASGDASLKPADVSADASDPGSVARP